MSSPSAFKKSSVKFTRLSPMPKNRPYTIPEIEKALKALHKMVHDQAERYGGEHSELVKAGIAESLLKEINSKT
jgi:hypothetical protein